MNETEHNEYEGMPWTPKVAKTMQLISLQKECGWFSRLKTHDSQLIDITIESIKLKIEMYEQKRARALA